MNWAYGATGYKTRLEIVQDVATDLLETISGVNVGLAYFNRNTDTSNDGERIAYAIEDIETARGPIQAVINGLVPDGNTPLAETLYETAQYFTGGKVTYGTASVPESREPGDSSLYHSPIDYNCQKNFIVYLTDGEPTRDDAADSAIVNMTDFPDPNADPARGSRQFSEIVGATCDAETYPAGFNPSGGNVSTISPSFSPMATCRRSTESRRSRLTRSGYDRLAVARRHGRAWRRPVLHGGRHGDVGERAHQHRDDDSLGGHHVYGADGGRQRLQPHPELERPVHQRLPSLGPHTLAGQPQEVPNSRERRNDHGREHPIQASGRPRHRLLLPRCAKFLVCGHRRAYVEKGGAASLIPADPGRKVYTYLGSDSALTHTSNRVNTTNLTDALLEIDAGDPPLDKVVNFINNVDVTDTNRNNSTTDPRNQMGDPLHSQPVSVIYGPGLREGLVFMATNDGVLHAVDLESGIEHWAFIPPEFLPDQVDLYTDDRWLRSNTASTATCAFR